MTKGDRVRIKSNGRDGTVVGAVAGFTLVKIDGGTKAMGYYPSELEVRS